MKSVLLFVVSLIAAFPSPASEAKAPVPMPSEAFTSPIKKVYAVREGDHRSVAYVVVWHQQEVIAVPLSRGSQNDDFVVGDSVRCVKHEVLSNGDSPPRFAFTVLGSAKSAAARSAHEEEVARLENSTVEIARRRADREAAAKK